MGNQNSIQRMNFEDIQQILKNKEAYCLINTLPINKQECLIPNTLSIDKEESYINELLKLDLDRHIVIYGTNTNDLIIYEKYDQLVKIDLKIYQFIKVGCLNGYVYKIYIAMTCSLLQKKRLIFSNISLYLL